ncbi:MAG: outer membrane beta-barrel protein [Pseudorhodoplanes sp.]
MNRTTLGAALIFAAAAMPAAAADMAYPVKAPIAPVPVFSWTGFYIGANVGFGGDNFDYPFSATQRQLQAETDPLVASTAGKFSLTSSGFFGGGQIGYNYQFANGGVFGIETDIQWSGIKGRFDGSQTVNDNGIVTSGTFNTGSEVEWFGTVRGRLGYAWDRLFLYGTGGGAYGKVNTQGSFAITGPNGVIGQAAPVTNSGTQWGWTAGAGLEYAIAPQWSFKTEYLYVDLGRTNLSSTTVNDVANGFFATSSMDVETRFHTMKAGVNYRF